MCACVLLNSTVSEGNYESPHELFYGSRAPTQDLRVFGCPVWVLLLKPKIAALGSRVRTKGVFVGYPMLVGSRQYLVLIDGKVIRSSDVQFYESQIAPVAPVTARTNVTVAFPLLDYLMLTFFLTKIMIPMFVRSSSMSRMMSNMSSWCSLISLLSLMVTFLFRH